jgi:ABC-type sugar transport system permease subunit
MEREGKIFPYIFLTPALVWIFFVYVIPIVGVIQFSLTRQSEGISQFSGFANYIIMNKDPLFFKALSHNLMLFFSVPVMIFLALVFASFLYDKVPGWQFYQVIIFIPVILAIAAIGIVFGPILQYNGLLNEILRFVRLDFLAKDWLGDSKIALWTLSAVIIWREVGFGTILFLARLMNVPVELYEVAKLDGATWWQTFWYVTIPQLSTVIEFYAVLQIITVFCWVFDYVYVMTGGGPVNSTIVGEFFIYKYAFQFNRIGVASAVAVVYLVASIILMTIRHNISKRLEV